MQQAELGDEVRSVVTGFRGIVVAKTEYLSGCERVAVESKPEKDHESPALEWIDLQEVEVRTRGAIDVDALRGVSVPQGATARIGPGGRANPPIR